MIFFARCRLKARKCKFRDEQELEERIIDQLIVGTRFPELQKQLLSKNETMTIEEVLNMCRSYEASIEYMKKPTELQRKNESQKNAVKHRPERSNTCSKCGLHHQHVYCPAQGSTCSAYRRKKHWAKMCQQARKKTDRQPQTNRFAKHKKFGPAQPAFKNRQSCINVQDQVCDEFERMSFHSVRDHTKKKSPGSEAFATLDVILPNRKGIHDLKIKVDTAAVGNTLSLRTFQQMFPEWVDQNGYPRPGTTQKESVILTAYNSSSIPQHGSVGIHCAYKGKWRYIKFYVVTSNGPTILGLPSLQELKLVTLHCPIQRTKYTPLNDMTATPAAPPKHTPINSTRDLIEAYPEQFDRIGDFAGEYHIVLRPNNHPMIHAPRNAPSTWGTK